MSKGSPNAVVSRQRNKHIYAKHYNGIRQHMHYVRERRSLGDTPAVAGNVAEAVFGLMKTERFQVTKPWPIVPRGPQHRQLASVCLAALLPFPHLG